MHFLAVGCSDWGLQRFQFSAFHSLSLVLSPESQFSIETLLQSILASVCSSLCYGLGAPEAEPRELLLFMPPAQRILSIIKTIGRQCDSSEKALCGCLVLQRGRTVQGGDLVISARGGLLTQPHTLAHSPLSTAPSVTQSAKIVLGLPWMQSVPNLTEGIG